MKQFLTMLALVILTTLFFTSCQSPKNIIKLEPEQGSNKWLYGQNFVSDSLYGIIFEVGFDQHLDNQYWFDFNIVNRSTLPILIDPSLFYCQAFDSYLNPITPEKIAAINPEDEILTLEKELSKNEARSNSQLGLTLFAAGVDIVTGIAVATDDNHHNDHHRTHLLYDVHEDKIATEFEAQSLNEMMSAWKNSTIRKTTLDSNYSMQGKIFFPSFPEASYIKLFIPVDEDFIEMGFKQIQFPVK